MLIWGRRFQLWIALTVFAAPGLVNAQLRVAELNQILPRRQDRPTQTHNRSQPAGVMLQAPRSAEPSRSRRLPPIATDSLTNAPSAPQPIQHKPVQRKPVQRKPVQRKPVQRKNTTKPAVTPEVLIWWQPIVVQPLRQPKDQVSVSVPMLFGVAARHSQKVQGLRQVPWIQQTQVDRAKAEFDPTIYSRSRYDDTSDPVGNALITGGPPRLNDNNWQFEAGIRKKTTSGATFRAFQNLGHKNSNSLFFVPNDQGSSRLSLGVTQPLLRGRGHEYNTSLIVTAKFESEAAQAQFERHFQNHLSEIAQNYWALYVARATMLQQERHLGRAVKIHQELKRRQVLDAVKSQTMRAAAAVATRRAELSQAAAKIKNAESRLLAQVNLPGLAYGGTEFVPVQSPNMKQLQVSLTDQVGRALKSRPEIREIVNRARAAQIRVKGAANELQPTLNLIAETYVAGLSGRSGVGSAWTRQFTRGHPSFGVGLEFELPYYNRAARANIRQQRLEARRLHHLLQETLSNIHSQVEIASRNVEAAFALAQGRHASLQAVLAEVAYLEGRWRKFRGDNSIGRLQLDDLLGAHNRLLNEEQGLTTAMAEYSLSLVELQRVTGALVQFNTE